jgi:methionyl-tRNA formyltransferase
MMSSLRIVYFSSQPSVVTNTVIGLFEQLGHKVLLNVLTPGTAVRPTQAYKDVVANHRTSIDTLITTHIGRLAPILRTLEPDIIFVTGFPRKLTPEILAVPRLGAINVHPALLPRYRGPDPFFWQFLNDEKATGLTVHRMAPEFDTGPILAQEVIPIGPDDTVDDVIPRLMPAAASAVAQALDMVQRGEPGTPQTEENASYAPLRTEADRLLDWTRPAAELKNRVRAWGSQGAVGEVNGEEWLIRRAQVASGAPLVSPGSVVTTAEGTAVGTADDLLLLVDAGPLSKEEQH